MEAEMDRLQAYATLGISDVASWNEIRLAYRTALRRYHPDTGVGDVRALQTVEAAYQEIAARRGLHRPGPPVARPGPTAGDHVDVYA
jgi:DnaJ-domain-containing protein 1